MTKNAGRCSTGAYSETTQSPWLFWQWDLSFDVRNDSDSVNGLCQCNYMQTYCWPKNTICSALNGHDDYELDRLPSCILLSNVCFKSSAQIDPNNNPFHDLKLRIKRMLSSQSIWGTVIYDLSKVSTSYWMYSTKYPIIIFWGQWHPLIYTNMMDNASNKMRTTNIFLIAYIHLTCFAQLNLSSRIVLLHLCKKQKMYRKTFDITGISNTLYIAYLMTQMDSNSRFEITTSKEFCMPCWGKL